MAPPSPSMQKPATDRKGQSNWRYIKWIDPVIKQCEDRGNKWDDVGISNDNSSYFDIDWSAAWVVFNVQDSRGWWWQGWWWVWQGQQVWCW